MVMYGQSCFSSARTTMPGAAGMCCCRSWTLMPFLRDVDNLVIALDAARDAALARGAYAVHAGCRDGVASALALLGMLVAGCGLRCSSLTSAVRPCVCFGATAQGATAAAIR